MTALEYKLSLVFKTSKPDGYLRSRENNRIQLESLCATERLLSCLRKFILEPFDSIYP